MEKLKEKRKKLAAVLYGIAAIAVIIIGIISYTEYHRYQTMNSRIMALIPAGSVKTDFGTTTPPDFPTGIFVENGAAIINSFRVDSVGQKWWSVVSSSAKTVTENESLYAESLKNQNWTIVHTDTTNQVYHVQATKDTSTVDITVTGNASGEAKSYVYLSVVTK